jgi:hypothetical protein
MIKNIKITELKPNTGQIEGLPANPRQINETKFEKLKRSLQDDPEMLALREILVFEWNNEYVIIGGNMRFRAAVDLGIKALPCKIIPPETPVSKLKAYVIKDNAAYGEYDWDLLADEWDSEDLDDWGVDVWQDDDKNIDSLPDELKDVDLTPDELKKIQGDDKTLTERIIIVYRPEEKPYLENLLGVQINKVVLDIKELINGER